MADVLASIRQKIREALHHERQTGTLARHLQSTLLIDGRPAAGDALAEAVELCRRYVERVPMLAELAIARAEAMDELDSIDPLLEAAGQYFLAPNDLIPDHLGLLGLLDDAYLASKLFEVMSEAYRQATGVPLIDADLAPANRMIVHFIGRDLAETMDRSVDEAVARRVLQLRLEDQAARRQATAARVATQDNQPRQRRRFFEDEMADFYRRNGISYTVEKVYVDEWGNKVY